MQRVVSLFLPSWATDRLYRRLGKDAPSRDKPLALIDRVRNRRVVAAMNEAGAAQGLLRGMSATQAQALVAGLATFDADPAEDAAGLDRLARWALLLAIPRAPLILRFGQEFGQRLDQALGHLAEPITPVAIEEAVTVSRPFAEAISAPETLIRHTGLLNVALCTALEKKSLGARKLDLLLQRLDRFGTAYAH